MTAIGPQTKQRKRLLWGAKLHDDDRNCKGEAVHVSSDGGVKTRIDRGRAIEWEVVAAIERLGSLPGEFRWEKGNLAGMREDASEVDERLRGGLGMKEM